LYWPRKGEERWVLIVESTIGQARGFSYPIDAFDIMPGIIDT
jgi:hypothetical protein